MRWLKHWWPVLVWAAVISTFSTGAFTGENTSRIIIPVLHFFFPWASPETLSAVHHVIRKCGHLTEYFILSLLILRAFRAEKKDFGIKWALVTILIVAAYASLD